MGDSAKIRVKDLTMAYGDFVVMRDLNFDIQKGEVQVIMGGSGCGKSTLLKHLVGLVSTNKGDIFYDGQQFVPGGESYEAILRRFGVLFQSGALWSSMTVEENIAFALEQYTKLKPAEIKELVELKLSLVGLAGFGDRFPSELSGGMKKRAGLARAIALDPEVLFFDEPSAGLDPLSSRRLDDLILELRAALGATIVVVTHELASIFAIADRALFLDIQTRTALCNEAPKKIVVDEATPVRVREFLLRGEEEVGS